MNEPVLSVPKGYVALADVLDIATTRVMEPYFDFGFGPVGWLRNRKLFRFVRSIPTNNTFYDGIFLRLLDEIGSMGRSGHLATFWCDDNGIVQSLDQSAFSEPLTIEDDAAFSGHSNSNFVLDSLGGKIPILPRNSAFLDCIDELLSRTAGISPPHRKQGHFGCFGSTQWEDVAAQLPYWPLDFACLVIDLYPNVQAAITKYAAYLEYGGRKFAKLMSVRHMSGYLPYIADWARTDLISVHGVRGGNKVTPEQPRKIDPLEWLDLEIQFVHYIGYIACFNRADDSDIFWHDLAVSRTSLTATLDSAREGQRPKGRPPTIRQSAEMAVRDLYPPEGKRPKDIAQDAAVAAVNKWLKEKGLGAVGKDTVLRALGERKS